MTKKLTPLFFVAAFFAAPVFAGESSDAFGDVAEAWCLDAEAKEIYTIREGGVCEVLVISEAVVMDGKTINATETEQVFDEGLVEAIDGAETTNESGDRCRKLKAPGFSSMFNAFKQG